MLKSKSQQKFRAANLSSLLKDMLDIPTLSVFVWQNGARFDRTINDYMSAPFPVGIDPSNPDRVRNSVLFSGNLTTSGIILTGNASVS